MIRAWRLPRNQRNANAAPVKRALAACVVLAPERERADPERHVDEAEQRRVGRHQAAAAHRRRDATTSAGGSDAPPLPGAGLRRRASSGSTAPACSHSELPRPRALARRSRRRIRSAARLAAFFAGAPDDFADVELELDDGLLRRLRARRCARVPRGEVVTYGELAALAGAPGRGARGRDVLRPQPALAVRSLPPRRRRRTGSAPSARSASTTSAGCSRSRVSFSDELRDELASIAPRRRCCRLAELSALCHAAGVWHLRGRGELAVHLDLASAGRGAARLQRSCASSASAREIRTYRRDGVRPRDALPAPRRRRRRRGGALPRGGRALGARLAPLRAAAQARRRPLLLPRRLPARARCSAAGALSGPRAPHLELRASEPRGRASCSPSVAARGGRRAAASPSGATPRGRLREVGRDDRRPARARRRRARPRSGSTSTPSSRRRARRQTGSRTPTRRTSSAPCRPPSASSRRSGSSTLDALPGKLARDRGAAAAAPGALARRARGEVPAADHEGGGPPPHGRAAAARRVAELAEPRGAGRGSSAGRAPPLSPHARTRWRRTGSESGASGRGPRGAEYLARSQRFQAIATRYSARPRRRCRVHALAFGARDDAVRGAARAAGRDQRPRRRRRDPRLGPAGDDAAARGRRSGPSSSRRSAGSRTRSSPRPRSGACSTSSRASRPSTTTTRSRRA